MTCPECGSENTPFVPRASYMELVVVDWVCLDCGHRWSSVQELGKDIDFGKGGDVLE